VDKFILHGKELTEYLDGGSALHLNLDEALSAEQYLRLFNIAAATGCNYFCINVKITICNECDHIDKRTLHACPQCHSQNIDYGTRVIGYLKRVSAFSQARQQEHQLRHYHRQSHQPTGDHSLTMDRSHTVS
jgi:ribonucleoside-triphosphate reductase